ncbi:hypothetical protein AX769_15655 [Frondihabitans sp. PAMC 28766]|uniref:hypothetical protein n=1 Tax=Frondihabitans sp. PAMC 28766 TaxID=1795630 RepID=UPI00078D8F17|nr:hypothetical protein [Frondihabitans sp. PAMC 28766]AMM21301.1 hypothetical protein AX769_15655 [Frondihabitans sp. PAMC 28766]
MSDSVLADTSIPDDAARVEDGDMRRSPGVFVVWIVCLAITALLLADDTWTAVQNIATVPSLITKNYDFYRANHLTGLVKPVPWAQLVVAVIAPAVGFAAALWVGRGRSLGRRLLALLAVICAVSAVAASISAYISSAYQL